MNVRARIFHGLAAVVIASIALCSSAALAQTSAIATMAAANLTDSKSTDSQPADAPAVGFVFQKRVDEVNLLFTVVDHKGRFISNLKLDDLEVLDDRMPPEKIHNFQQESDLPLRVALLIDISSSVTARIKYERKAAIEFLKKVLRPDKDKAMVIGFNQSVHLEQDFINDVPALRRAVMRLHPGGETALYEAIVYAANKLQKESEGGTRKVIILITDGENNGGKAIMNDAQQSALHAEAPIYSLSTNDVKSSGYTNGEATMELLSKYTGGELLPACYESELARAFEKVEKALRNQYVLSYKPAEFVPDGRYRAVALSARHAKLKVECRHGYFAPRD